MSGRAWAIQAAVTLAMTLASTGCREDPQAKAAASAAARAELRKYNGVIAFVGSCERDALWPVLKASAQRYDREMCSYEVRYLCPRNDSPQEQIDLLKALGEQGIRGLCVQIDNLPATERTLRALYDRGVKIVSMVKPAPESIRSAHVGFDETEIGSVMATALVHAVGEQGTVMVLHAGTKDPIYSLRLAGFEAEMDRNRRLQILAEIDCKADGLDARKIISERAARFPRLSAWVSLDDWPLRGIGLTEKPLPPGSKLITFGAYPSQWPWIRDGTLPIVVAANYQEMGQQALEACEVAARNSTRFKPVYFAPLRTVHQRNLDAFIADWSIWAQPERNEGKAIPTADSVFPISDASR